MKHPAAPRMGTGPAWHWTSAAGTEGSVRRPTPWQARGALDRHKTTRIPQDTSSRLKRRSDTIATAMSRDATAIVLADLDRSPGVSQTGGVFSPRDGGGAWRSQAGSAADEPGDRVRGFLELGLLFGAAGLCRVQDALAGHHGPSRGSQARLWSTGTRRKMNTIWAWRGPYDTAAFVYLPGFAVKLLAQPFPQK